MERLKRYLLKTLVLSMLLSITICCGQTFAAKKGVSFKLSKKVVKIKKKKSKTIKVKKLKGAKKVKWSISDKSVAKIKRSKKSVKVIGKKDGVAALRAQAGGVTVVCKINEAGRIGAADLYDRPG